MLGRAAEACTFKIKLIHSSTLVKLQLSIIIFRKTVFIESSSGKLIMSMKQVCLDVEKAGPHSETSLLETA